MAKSKIAWTESTWNPVVGCTKVSDGCKFCYAEKMAFRLARMGQEKYQAVTGILGYMQGWNGKIFCDESALDIPLKRKKPTMYFVCSMGDLFHKDVPYIFIDEVISVMALCSHHVFQVLTKRPERMEDHIGALDKFKVINFLTAKTAEKYNCQDVCIPAIWPLPNLWLGTSASNQKDLDKNVPYLLQTPAAVRFLSLEPLLADMDLRTGILFDKKTEKYIENMTGVDRTIPDWVIIGAESKGAYPGRECKLSWIENIVEQCKTANVKVFVKQIHLGGKLVKDIEKFPKHLQIREFPEKT